MKIAKCATCGKVETWEFAERDGWDIQQRFDEAIYGFWACCPDCRKNM